MSYVNEVITDSPVNFYRLADPSGHIARDVGSRREDMWASVVQLSSIIPSGFSGPTSDGSSKFFDFAVLKRELLSAAIVAPYSIEMVTYVFDQPNAASNHELFEWLDAGGAANTKFEFFQTGTGSYHCAVGGTNHTIGGGRDAWHHLCVTDDGTNSKAYLDAVLTSTQAHVGNLGGGRRSIGGLLSGSVSQALFLGEVAIYASTLSPTRITAHYLALDQLALAPTFAANSGSVQSNTSQILAAVTREFLNPA